MLAAPIICRRYPQGELTRSESRLALRLKMVRANKSVYKDLAWHVALRMVTWQLVLACLSGAVFFAQQGGRGAVAAFSGGLMAAFLSAFVALRFFSVPPEFGPQQMLRSMFRAEAVKWVWVVLLFGAAARFIPNEFMALIVGFLVSSMVYWWALLWYPTGIPRKRH
ncbi:MAG: hypothetical protein DRQ52_09490 [Gammaproteobacteria bacterium]|nr:MAG: hypothetical protein DRQ52_09490 [Gammaproteobacteria bacterium]